MIVLDYSDTRPNPQAMKDAGVEGVARYIGLGSRAKRIDAAERDRLLAAGLGITLVAEAAADRSTAGRAAGAADAAKARLDAGQLGYPASMVLYYAVDFDASWPQVSDYFAGVASVDPYWGVYGSAKICMAATGDAWRRWATTAWSHHQRIPCALFQKVGGPVAGQFAGTDENDCFDPSILWHGQLPPILPKPQPQEHDVTKIVQVKESGTLWAINGVGRRAITSSDAGLLAIAGYAVFDKGGVPFQHPKATVELVPVIKV